MNTKNKTPIEYYNNEWDKERQGVLPMDVGIAISRYAPIRLLISIIKMLDLSNLYEIYDKWCARRCKWAAERKRIMRSMARKGQKELLPDQQTREEDSEDWDDYGLSREGGKGRPRADCEKLLIIVIYSYMINIYSSRKIRQSCKENINYLWVLGGNKAPSHTTVNSFRRHVLGPVAERLFYNMVKCLGKLGEIVYKNVFIDGTKLEANANKYTYVWRKVVETNLGKVREALIRLAGEINAREGSKFEIAEGDWIKKKIREMKNYLIKQMERSGEEYVGRGRRRGERQKEIEELEVLLEAQETGENHLKILGKRNSYSKTDKDATFMRMKDDTLRAAYNPQLAVEGEYIVGAEIFQNASDAATLKPFFENLCKQLERVYESLTADAGYESEENYSFLDLLGVKAFIMPTNYKRSKTKKYQEDISKSENMKYDKEGDMYICANGKGLVNIGTREDITKNGYKRELTVYECVSCSGCGFKSKCTEREGNRQIQVSKKFLEMRERSLNNIRSTEGILLRVNRSIQSEGAFGVEKEDHHFRRFLLRKLEGVRTELFLLCMGYNMNKLHNKIQQGRLGTSLHIPKEKKLMKRGKKRAGAAGGRRA